MKWSVSILVACASLMSFCVYGQQAKQPTRSNNFHKLFSKAQYDFQEGRLTDALLGFQNYIKYDPSCAVAYFNCGVVLSALGQHAQAIEYFERSLKDSPSFAAAAHFKRGDSLYHEKRYDEALRAFKQAIESNSQYADAYAYIAKIELEQSRPLIAMPYAMQAAQLQESYAVALMTVAIALRDAYLFDEAIACFQLVVEVRPHDYSAYLHLGDLFNLQKKMDEALQAYQRAYELNNQCHEAAHNIGMILLNKEQETASEQWLQLALRIKPDFMWPHIGLSCLYLSSGDFVRGWREYEWRLVNAVLPIISDKPQWDGSDLRNKTILLYAEQGFGDTFHFIRYAQQIKQRYQARIVVLPQKQLVNLIQLCPYVDQVLDGIEPIPEFDCYASMMSLPYLCGATLDTIPLDIPYLYPRTDLAEKWHMQLAVDTNFKIGICWHVDPSHDCLTYSHMNKKLQVAVPKRSMPLALLADIAQVPGVSVYSLQRFNGLEELAELENPQVIQQFAADFDQTNGRFMDTAAVIKNLDLVITVDTSIAHLAGALGTPTWILLPYAAEWRWLKDRSDSPWYPSVRLFRQPAEYDWQAVMDKVMPALADAVAAHYRG